MLDQLPYYRELDASVWWTESADWVVPVAVKGVSARHRWA
jgi:hypothetical protein